MGLLLFQEYRSMILGVAAALLIGSLIWAARYNQLKLRRSLPAALQVSSGGPKLPSTDPNELN